MSTPDRTPPADLEKLRRYHAEIGEILSRYDAKRNPVERMSRHVRRHLPLYALGAIFALVVILIPTRNQNAGPASTLTAGSNTNVSGGEVSNTTGAAASSATSASAASGGGPAGAATVGSSGGSVAGGPIGTVRTGSGVTRGGIACRPGVRQLPNSSYAAACVDKFNGNNGGATYRGVTADAIKIVIRKTADSGGPSAQTVDQANKAAGRASRTEYLQFVDKYWLPYFNKMYELYGRKVVFVEYGSTQSNGVDEAQSKGKDGACADADTIASSIKAFGDLLFTTGFQESQPFAECAKEKGGIWVPLGAPYYPEGAIPDPKGVNLTGVSYRSWDPYVWSTVMNCEQIAYDVAEYMGKRLNNRLAKWAKDPAYQKEKRVFGTYVPDNPGYQHCVNVNESTFASKYGGKIAWRHNYPLDVSRFPDQAAQAVLEFQSHGVTTLINACDTISTELMTTAANRNGWGPEWLLIGVATQDTNGSARTFDQTEVGGHMFGMSQLGPDALTLAKGSEPYEAFARANPGVSPPQGSLQAYWPMVHIFNMLQAAGPILTPANIAAAAHRLAPGGGAKGAVGTWSMAKGHTEIIDSREIYWDANVPKDKSGDGGTGAYIETYGGRRFASGQWPAEEPSVYPK